MYVCLCKGVTDRLIKQEIENGAKTVKHLAKSLGVCTGCGRCAKHAKLLLNENVAIHNAA
jgi:bacterioferritin-associated ferredoxin